MNTKSLNLIEIDSLIDSFLKEHESGISNLHRIFFKTDDELSLRALKEGVKEELRNGCVSFINNNSPMEEINNYLFYIVNAFCKKSSNSFLKKKVEYICPGCLFLGKEYSLLLPEKILECDECSLQLKLNNEPQKLHFFNTFSRHNKNGYKCQDCKRFIPHPLDNALNVTCPYFDCLFVGPINALDKMHHPSSKSNPEKLILDSNNECGISMKDNITSSEMDIHLHLELNEELNKKISLIKDIIDTQSTNASYSSSGSTLKHRQLVYQAILNLLDQNPIDMTSYLLNSLDSHVGFQHKIFQEYIRLLEESLPFFISKNKKMYKIDNLLDNNLCLFDGISVFETKINDKLIIKNETKEFYIGGRKASYTKPYYIGKLLNIVDNTTKLSLMDNVKEYSFSRIKMEKVKPYTSVTVTHLRVPPHYQMGGMVYVNRVRKKIVEKAKNLGV